MKFLNNITIQNDYSEEYNSLRCVYCRGCFEDPAYFAEWKDPKDFTEILVCPEMISDHFPDKVLKSLKLLSAKNFTPHSRNPGPIDDTKV